MITDEEEAAAGRFQPTEQPVSATDWRSLCYDDSPAG